MIVRLVKDSKNICKSDVTVDVICYELCFCKNIVLEQTVI